MGFRKSQAEVLVKKHVPLEYIMNIDKIKQKMRL
ncbi:MAG: DUF4433 domain-containing protein [Bacteroidales bacterium]|nr:DUF4433 domain-containing protein [Bacteroidales bacterium]